MKVKYIGEYGARSLSAADLTSLGVKGHDAVWDASNDHVADVPDEVADKLIELMPDEFEKVK